MFFYRLFPFEYILGRKVIKNKKAPERASLIFDLYSLIFRPSPFIFGLSRLVPRAGVEPARHCCHWCLRPARLPIPPPGHGMECTKIKKTPVLKTGVHFYRVVRSILPSAWLLHRSLSGNRCLLPDGSGQSFPGMRVNGGSLFHTQPGPGYSSPGLYDR